MKTNNKIIVSVLIVNFNSSDFIEISLYAISKLTKNYWKAYILDNGSKIKDYKKLEKIIENYDNVILERWETNLRGSIAHGTGLNYLVSKVDTPYFSVLDADATWLMKEWDKILISKIDDRVKVIGTEASGNKPKDFPLMYAIFFETETFRKLNIDFRPRNVSNLEDTGWEIREKYLEAGYEGLTLKYKNTRTYKKGPFKDVICAEYYLNGVDHIFASHFGRGSTLGVNKYCRSEGVSFFYRLPKISKPLRIIRGIREKNKWSRICKKIINNQVK